jgi:hypothetical protein
MQLKLFACLDERIIADALIEAWNPSSSRLVFTKSSPPGRKIRLSDK